MPHISWKRPLVGVSDFRASLPTMLYSARMISTPSDGGRDDVDFEPEDELGSAAALTAKLAKVRAELEAIRKERQEYLDGWQRAKADLINERRELASQHAHSAASATERAIEAIIPTLDSFDLAMQGQTWQDVDGAWRVGVEGIARPLESALAELGAQSFGKAGEPYDPARHEIVGEEPAETPLVVVRIARRGWQRSGRIIRPAHIIISA